MADFTGGGLPYDPGLFFGGDPYSGPLDVVTYFQRVYDTVLNQWCYYTGTDLTAIPTSAETTPASTPANRLAGSHVIIRVYTPG
jgi:hypothetical protein